MEFTNASHSSWLKSYVIITSNDDDAAIIKEHGLRAEKFLDIPDFYKNIDCYEDIYIQEKCVKDLSLLLNRKVRTFALPDDQYIKDLHYDLVYFNADPGIFVDVMVSIMDS